MKRKSSKQVSNEELARMVQTGFDYASKENKERFDAIDSQFEKVDREFRVVHHKIDTLTRRVDALVDYNRRIARLERLVDSILKR